MADLVSIDFYGDRIEVQEDAEPRVVVRRICENLGIAPQDQYIKLRKSAWSSCKDILATGSDGKSYRMTTISLKAVPMWLAGISEDRVAPHVREKLVRYQLECADVLADHFMPHTAAPAAASIDLDSNDGLLVLASKLTDKLLATTKRAEEAEGKVLQLSANLEAAEVLVGEAADAVAFVDVVRQTDDEWTSYEAAQILQQKPKAFIQWMINERILFKRDCRIQVYAQHRPKYARIRFSKPFINAKTGKEETSETVVFNRAGIEWLAKKLGVTPYFSATEAAE